MPLGNKPLPEPTSIQIYAIIWRRYTRQQCILMNVTAFATVMEKEVEIIR